MTFLWFIKQFYKYVESFYYRLFAATIQPLVVLLPILNTQVKKKLYLFDAPCIMYTITLSKELTVENKVWGGRGVSLVIKWAQIEIGEEGGGGGCSGCVQFNIYNILSAYKIFI